MAAKYDVDDSVTIVGKVSEVVSNETGTTYKVKFKANNAMQNIWFEEGDLVVVDDSNVEPVPEAGE